MKRYLIPLVAMLFCVQLRAQSYSDTLHVVHYDLSMDITDFANRALTGDALLTVVAKAGPLSEVRLDLQGLTVDSVWVQGVPASFVHSGTTLAVSHDCQPSDTLLVRVRYHGTPVADPRWGGFYFSGEYCYNMGVAFDYQPHNFGRCWYPCLDMFTDKSSYTMHIRTQAGKRAICGGTLTDSLTHSDGTRTWTWQLDEPIPTYLSSIAVGPYQCYADTVQGMERVIPIEIWAQPNSVNHVAGSFANLKSILHLFEQKFGPYRWPRVGYVAVNFSSGAMEHATNIAYPNAAIDGTTNYQSLFAHELFHHWFGDLITCNRAEEMWLNEGYATYSEALVNELVAPNGDGYLDYIRGIHHNTLKTIVKEDGAHYALDNVPQDVTYGTHAYDKGALIVHTLRGAMGDSLFFGGLQGALEHFAWGNVSSQELINYLSQVSGINLTDFYEGWIHAPGFPHFAIDSVVRLDGDNYRVYMRQKRCGGTQLVPSQKLDLTFASEQRALHTVSDVVVSGATGTVDVEIPFLPCFGMVDFHEKLCDAVVDYTPALVSGNTLNLSDANCTVSLSSFPDTVLVRVEHNLVAPDQQEQRPEGIHRISDTHFWTVGMAYDRQVNTIPEGYLKFQYQSNGATSLDHELMSGFGKENLKLLYRSCTGDDWQIVPSTVSGSNYSGSLKVEMLRPGQYCLAVGDVQANVESVDEQVTVKLWPNPSGNQLNVWIDGLDGRVSGVVYDSTGRCVLKTRLRQGSNTLQTGSLPAGNYLLVIQDAQKRTCSRTFVKR